MFYHQGPAMVHVMRYLTLGVFENLETTSYMDVDKELNTEITSLG